MFVSKNPSGPNATSHTPNATSYLPNVSRWNIGLVGSPHVGARVGRVDFMLFMSISFALGLTRTRFSVEYKLLRFLM